MRKRAKSSSRHKTARPGSQRARGRFGPGANTTVASSGARARAVIGEPARSGGSSTQGLLVLRRQLRNRNVELGRLADDLSILLSGVDIPLVILDGARRIRRFTPQAQALLGLSTDDVGRPMGKLRLRVSIPKLSALIASAIKKEGSVRREIRTANGHWYWLRIRPFRTAEQRIAGVLMAFLDINELKKNEEALQAERNFISAVLDAAKDLLVVVLDREGRIVEFNRACQHLTGYSAEEVKGRKPWEFLIPGNEREKTQKLFERLVAGRTNQAENHWIAKNGRRLLIRWSNSPVVIDGSVESIIGTGIDHTERAEARLRMQQSEATVRALLETAAQAIVAIDRRGRIVLANATAEKMFGYSRAELLGTSLEILLPERMREVHRTHRLQWYFEPRNRRMGTGLALMGLRKDASEFPIDVSLSHIGSGEEVLGVAFISDATERKKNEEALLDHQERLRRLTANLLTIQENENRELARELHDAFSQELAALRMEVSALLASPQIAGKLAEPLAALGRKIGRLADEMHRTSRQLHPAILSELGLEAAIRDECSALSEQLGIPVTFACRNVPVPLPDDVALALYRVTQESLRNIRKHSGATEAHVNLRGENGGVSLQVRDTGDGFDLEKVRKSGGLGLISMEERVRMVSGKFNIQSAPGTGTTVKVLMPLR